MAFVCAILEVNFDHSRHHHEYPVTRAWRKYIILVIIVFYLQVEGQFFDNLYIETFKDWDTMLPLHKKILQRVFRVSLDRLLYFFEEPGIHLN